MELLRSNYHTHTKRCHHATGEEYEYVENAIALGIEVFGFSDHSPMIFRGDYKSPVRMDLHEADGYFETLTRLRERYKDDIEIHIGVEAEYFPDTFEETMKFLEQYPCEYILLAQHYLWNEETGDRVSTPCDSEEKLISYYRNICEGVDTGKFTCIAHPDMFNFTGDIEIYRRHTEDFLLKMKEKDIPLGINRLGISRKRNYPRKDFWDIAGRTGNKCIIELDAHSPEDVIDKDGIAGCLKLAVDCGLNLIEKLEL